MFKRYKLSDDKWSPDDLDKDIEYAILYDVFGVHWGGGFTQDVEEMLEICKRMVVALEKELQNRNNEHMETLMRAIYCVQKQMYDTGKIGKGADND